MLASIAAFHMESGAPHRFTPRSPPRPYNGIQSPGIRSNMNRENIEECLEHIGPVWMYSCISWHQLSSESNCSCPGQTEQKHSFVSASAMWRARKDPNQWITVRYSQVCNGFRTTLNPLRFAGSPLPEHFQKKLLRRPWACGALDHGCVLRDCRSGNLRSIISVSRA